MNIRKYSWTILALFFLLSSCEKDTEPINFAPSVTTGSAADLYRFGATLSGSVSNPNGYTLKEYGVQYSLYQGFTEVVNVAATAGSNPENFSVAVGGLEPGTGYYYRTYAYSGYSTIYSEARLFSTTNTNAPVFGQTMVDNVTLTGFDVSAELLDDGGSELMMKGFILKPAESEDYVEFYYDTPGSTILTCGEDFQTTVKDLYTGTLYAIRPYGVANGVGYGKIAYVRTLTTDKTVLSSCVFSDTLVNSVFVQAHVLSAGTHRIVETGFCYSSESTQPTVNNLTVPATLSDNSFYATLDDLNSATLYYVRAYAKSEDGEYTYGETSEYFTKESSYPFDVQEYEVLKQLYEETNGQNWRNNENWLSEKPLNTWYGITLDNDGHVKSINLQNNNLTGTFRLNQLEMLQSVNIDDNALESVEIAFLSPNANNIELSNCVTNYGPITVQGANVASVTIKNNKQLGNLVIDCNTLMVDGCDFGDVYTPFSTVNAEHVTINNSTMFNCGLNNDYLIFRNSKTTDTWHCVTNMRAELIDSYCATICSWDFSTEAVIVVSNTELFQPEWNESKSGIYTFTTNSEGWAKMFAKKEVSDPRLCDVIVEMVTDSCVVVKAEILDDGGNIIYDKGFCYVEGTAVPTVSDNRVASTDEGPVFTATVSSLKADTQYTICAYAINELGEMSYSAPLTVTTSKHTPSKDDAIFPDTTR